MGSLKAWSGGLLSALFGALSGCLGGAMADPSDFNLATSSGRQKLMVAAFWAAIVPVCAYLAKSPLPGIEPSTVTTTTATTVSHPAPSTVLVETTEQVKTEAVVKKDS